MSEHMGFFTNELYQYYLQRGKTISDNVMSVLDKSISDLNADELETYEKLILPGKEAIKTALRYRLERRGTNREEWKEQITTHDRSIIEKLAAELLAGSEAGGVPGAYDQAEGGITTLFPGEDLSMSDVADQEATLAPKSSLEKLPYSDSNTENTEPGEKSLKAKSIVKKVLNVLFWAFFAVVCVLLILLVLSLFNLGIRAFAVSSSSMSPTIDAGSLVFVRSSEGYEAGDIVTYIAPNDEYITHRIEEVRTEEGSRVFITKGAANDDVDPYLVSQEDIEGKVALTIPYFGYAVAFLRTRIGFILIMTVFGLLIVSLLWDIIKEPSASKEQSGMEPSGD